MRPRPPTARRARLRGAIVVQAAIALSIVVIVLIGSELGYLFYLKREMQKTVDLAALAGAQVLTPGDAAGCAVARTAAVANAAQNLAPPLALVAADVICGRWDPVTQPVSPHFSASTGGLPFNALSIVMRRTPALLLPGLPGNRARAIEVRAMGAQRLPRAALTLRTTLASVDSTRSVLLNGLFTGLLGGNLNLSVAGWNGLIGARLQLRPLLDQLAIDLGVAAGRYDTVVDTRATAGVLLQAAITALQRQGGTAQVALDALEALRIAANAAATRPLVRIGDLLGVQTGTPAAGLELDLQLFQFAEGVVQLANSQNGLAATVPLSIAGLINLTTQVKVIEPPQISAVGDPRLASLDPTGPNRIGVRSAQLRSLVTVELPVLSAVAGLVNALTAATAPLMSTLNSLLSLNLADVLACAVVCTNQAVTTVSLLPAPLRIDLNLDVGAGESHVTGVSCARGAPKSLTTSTRTAIADLRIGKMGSSVADARQKVFASAAPPVVEAVPLVDVSAKICTKVALVLMSCGPVKNFHGGGLGLQAAVPVGATTATQVFASPPDLGQAPLYQTLATQNIVDALAQTLQAGSGLVHALPATGSVNGGSASVLAGIASTLATVLNSLANVVSGVLSPLLDGLLDTVLRDLLGLNLAQTEVGANLSCTQGAALVY